VPFAAPSAVAGLKAATASTKLERKISLRSGIPATPFWPTPVLLARERLVAPCWMKRSGGRASSGSPSRASPRIRRPPNFTPTLTRWPKSVCASRHAEQRRARLNPAPKSRDRLLPGSGGFESFLGSWIKPPSRDQPGLHHVDDAVVPFDPRVAAAQPAALVKRRHNTVGSGQPLWLGVPHRLR
jgi:hypothetical protein